MLRVYSVLLLQLCRIRRIYQNYFVGKMLKRHFSSFCYFILILHQDLHLISVSVCLDDILKQFLLLHINCFFISVVEWTKSLNPLTCDLFFIYWSFWSAEVDFRDFISSGNEAESFFVAEMKTSCIKAFAKKWPHFLRGRP